MSPAFHATSRVFAIAGLLMACERTPTHDGDQPARVVERSATRAGREVAQATREVAHTAEHGIESTAESARRALTPEGHETPAAVNSGAVTMAFNEALDGIASARCEREQRCNNVGSGKRYESLGACRAAVRASFADDLNPSDCRAGIDRSELRECLQEVRSESCGNPVDTLERVVACRTSDLCRNTTVSLR